MLDEAETFARRIRTRRRILVAIALMVPLVPVLYLILHAGVDFFRQEAAERAQDEAERRAATLTDDQLAELRMRLKPARDAVATRRAAFLADITPQKLDQVRPSDAPCRSERITSWRDSGINRAIGGLGGPVVLAPAAMSVPPPDDDDKALQAIDQALARGERDSSLLSAVERIAGQGEDVAIVIGPRTLPRVNPIASNYVPGAITGKAYIYSYPQRRILCFAEVAAQNSPTIQIRYDSLPGASEVEARSITGYQELVRDLDSQLREQLAQRMRATGT
jgi:hypothetical protein